MNLSRRRTLLMGAAAVIVLPRMGWAAEAEDAIAAFTGGGAVTDDATLTLIAPEIAENGNTVPIEVEAPGAAAIMIVATANPIAHVGTFRFGPLAGARRASTRIRLSGTQHVVAVARMEDGTFRQSRREVKVTIGGCGG